MDTCHFDALEDEKIPESLAAPTVSLGRRKKEMSDREGREKEETRDREGRGKEETRDREGRGKAVRERKGRRGDKDDTWELCVLHLNYFKRLVQ